MVAMSAGRHTAVDMVACFKRKRHWSLPMVSLGFTIIIAIVVVVIVVVVVVVVVVTVIIIVIIRSHA